MEDVKKDLKAQGMNIREAVNKSRNRQIWRSLVEAASSSAHAWWRRKKKKCWHCFCSLFCEIGSSLFL